MLAMLPDVITSVGISAFEVGQGGGGAQETKICTNTLIRQFAGISKEESEALATADIAATDFEKWYKLWGIVITSAGAGKAIAKALTVHSRGQLATMPAMATLPAMPRPVTESIAVEGITTETQIASLRVDPSKVPQRSRRFAQARANDPPLDPASIMATQVLPDWRPASEQDVPEVAFCSTRLESGTWEEQVWEWLKALALAGIKEENYYAGTEVVANAYLKGGESVPAVRCKSLNVTINWYLTRDGRIRVDGDSFSKMPTMAALRRSHGPYNGETQHGQQTGKSADKSKVKMANPQLIIEERAKWELDRKGTVLMIQPAEMYDVGGRTGVYDVLNDKVGCKSAPAYNTLPWIMALNSGTSLCVYTDGKVDVHLGTAAVQQAKEVEAILKGHFGASTISKSQYQSMDKSKARIRYGVPSSSAQKRLDGSVFRSGGMSLR